MAGVTIERSGGFSKEEHAINKLTRVAQWRSRCGTYVYLRQMPWHSPNTASPSAKVPPCLPHEHHRQQGRPTARRSSNNLTASTSSSRHAASYHPFQVALAVRRWCPRAAPARAAAGSTPLRRRGSGVCSACAPRGAKRHRATIVGRRSHVSEYSQTSTRSCCRERRWIVSGSRSHARFHRAPSWRSSETCPKRSMQSSWALVAQGLSA